MYHPHSISDARRLRIASLLLLGNRLLVLAAVALLLVSVFANDRHLMIFGSILVAFSVALIIAQWIAASQVGCPLCRTPVLAPMSCMKHRKARRLLGSYKLRVALAIMFTERFRCPYCNGHTEMEAGERLRGSRPRGSEMNSNHGCTRINTDEERVMSLSTLTQRFPQALEERQEGRNRRSYL